MNKKIVSIITIATILLSLIAFLPMSSAVTSNTQPNTDKIAPNLKAQMDADPTDGNRIIVVLQPGVDESAAANAITSLGGTVTSRFHVINAIATTLSADKILALSSLVSVDQILVDGKKYLPPDALGDDSGSQPVPGPLPDYYYAQFPFVIGADQAWNAGINGAGVVVADLDTGIYYQHLDLAGVVTDYKIFTGEVDAAIHDGNGHGTATTGLVAAQGILTYYGFLKVMGVAPGAKVIGGKVLTNGGWGWDSWIINGIDWAIADGANIITMSLGGLEIPNNGYDPTCLALEAATKQGVTCFVAAGNSQGAGTVSSAGDAKDIITVGASTDNSGEWNLYGYWPVNPSYVSGYENDQVIFWSSGGATADGRLDPDVCAPGAWGETLARSSTSAYLQFGGTSMATPVAAGAGALVYQAYKQAHGVFPSPAVVKDILMNTAKDLGLSANRQGAGRVDAYKAVEAALNSADYSNTDYISKLLPAGSSFTTSSTFTSTINSAQAVWLQYVSTTSFSASIPHGDSTGGTSAGSTWIPFTIPAGVDYADVRVKFDPVIAYGTPIRSYNGSTWTDVHINTALYKERTEGDPTDLILINYAYAHTNVQWLDARIDFGPGTYVLRFWNAYPTINPVDVQVNFYKFATWTWVSTTIMAGNKLQTKITVPKGTAPGIYSGFVKTTVSGSPIDIPIVITVPATVGKTFTLQANVMNEPRTGDSGDWYYIPVQGFTFGNIMLTATWATPDADFDVFLVSPAGHVVAASEAPLASLGYKWYTTTGTTMEMLSTFSLSCGYWYVGIHATYFGNTFGQTVTLKLSQGTPIDAPLLLTLTKKQTSKTFTVSNDIPGNVNVQAMALSLATEAYSSSITDTLTSVGGSNVGYNVYGIAVTPDMITLKVTLSWVGTHSLSLMLWDPFGHNAGTINTNGGSITINNPAIGVWAAIPTINDAGSQAFTLTVKGQHFKTYSGVTITPSAFTLSPLGTQTVTVTDTPTTPSGIGVIVYYDLTSGSTYERTLLLITH